MASTEAMTVCTTATGVVSQISPRVSEAKPHLLSRSQHWFSHDLTVGSNIAIWNQDKYVQESGTSASAPIVAALFNRIIEERIRVGKRGPIGLVNPTLYKNPQVLNDIKTGNNGLCSRHFKLLFGKEYGWNCTEGWDPVTGLGTPRYSELLKVFMDLP